ncbi:SprT family zinc-dependent metalloprotease [Alteromonas sp. ASW11-36]|uniref:SprT family zinc-dependent metalloprotease n=1 Tax=Alteromonas arenosi TaxID=3055817 RepID=A0ABT7SWL7_9ALTE|nr:SprT family zinc-dependent metalloprotease [Alteromonas sp. ASW11-36]MDM7860590.1 SprT family zinc-dependent metalloprotease [Alteromonas sp. ASW11-36]
MSKFVPQPLQDALQARVIELIDLATTWAAKSIKPPTLGFRAAGRNGGSAHLHKNHINLNRLFLVENPQHYMEQVLPHEIAHIVVHQLYGRVKPHGIEWQTVMQEVFKCPPQVTHHMQSSLVTSTTFPYQCSCGTVELTVRRHNKVMRQKQKYQCRRCGEVLRFASGESTKTNF